MNTEMFDAIVIGGGPAGSTAATLIAMDGHRVLLLERERFPRYHVGESLLPSTVHFMLDLLGCKEEVMNANFFPKPGGVYLWGASKEPWHFDFKEKYHKSNYAFQVKRDKFDHILLKNAQSKGVDVREEHAVVAALRDENDRVVGVRFKDANGQEKEAYASYVLDGSGQTGLMSGDVGKREYDKYFQHIAVYGYYENANRWHDPDRQGAGVFASFKSGWIWYLPLSNSLTGIGAVVHRDEAATTIKELGAEKALEKYLDACPIINDMLKPAHRVTEGDYGQVRVVKDYSYRSDKFWSPGCALIGDAACFIDPILATGVHLATFGGLQAARAVNTCLRGGKSISETKAFDEFEQRYRREFALWYGYMASFYEMNRDSSSYFWEAHKMLNPEASATPADAKDSFIQLASGLADTGEPLFQDGNSFLQGFQDQINVTQRRIEVAQGGDELTKEEQERMDSNRARIFRGMDETWMIANARRNGATVVAEQAKFKPTFEGGLVPTGDGLGWAVPMAA